MKRAAILLDSQQPNPPKVEEVIGVLRGLIMAPKNTVDALLGDIQDDEEKRKDMCTHYKTAVRAFLEYYDLYMSNGTTIGSLDEFLSGWARWCIKPEELYVSEEA